jgi:hypothetical protein
VGQKTTHHSARHYAKAMSSTANCPNMGGAGAQPASFTV